MLRRDGQMVTKKNYSSFINHQSSFLLPLQVSKKNAKFLNIDCLYFFFITTTVFTPMYPTTTLTKSAMTMTVRYDVAPAANVLARGGLILYPTDTIWSIGCDATDAAAVASIYKLTRRDPAESLVILVNSLEMLRQHVVHLHPRLETLLVYHQRPLTVIYDQGANLAPNLTAPNGNIAVCISRDEYCVNLIHSIGKPIVAAAAHVRENPYPSHFGEINSDIIQGVDYIEKYRQREKTRREPAVIVRLNKREELEFLRE